MKEVSSFFYKVKFAVRTYQFHFCSWKIVAMYVRDRSGNFFLGLTIFLIFSNILIGGILVFVDILKEKKRMQ